MHSHSPARHRHPSEQCSVSPAQPLESLLEAVSYSRAGPKANQEEVTSFGKPLAMWLAGLHPPVSFLPP